MICEIEISTEISVSFLERLHEIEREIISHRAAKTVNGNFIFGTEKNHFPCQRWCARRGSAVSQREPSAERRFARTHLFSPRRKKDRQNVCLFGVPAGALPFPKGNPRQSVASLARTCSRPDVKKTDKTSVFLVCPPGLCRFPKGTLGRASEARQDFKISCFIRNILYFLHIYGKYLTRFAYFT